MRKLAVLLIPFLFICNTLSAAIDCDGTDDFFEAATTSGLPTAEPISVGAWIRPDSVTGAHKFIGHGERNATPPKGWSFGTSGDELFFTTHQVKDYTTTNMTLVTGEWQFVGAALDSAFDVTFYHYRPSTDTLVTQQKLHSLGMNNPSTGPITVCALDNTLSATKTEYFDGKVDELFMADRVLTQREFELIFRSRTRYLPQQVATTDLEIYYPMDEFAQGQALNGVTITDRSVNTNNSVGDDGANDSGLTGNAGEVLTYP